VRAWLRGTGSLPVNVKVVIEGEEEIGSPHLSAFLEDHADRLQADVIVLTDLTNWQVGWPGLTYTLRGMGELYVTVRALEQPVHSGMWGGPIPDALTGLVKGLASLNDDQGRPAVEGLFDDVREASERELELIHELGEDAAFVRAEAGMLEGVEFIGDEQLTLWQRIWFQPTITVIGIDAPSVTTASNQLIAEARAKLSMRFAPGQDPQRAVSLVADHLRAHIPWGLRVELTEGPRNAAWVTEPAGPAFDAARAAMVTGYGREPALLGCGGSIPFVQPFSDAFGGAPCLLVGIEDPSTNAHGEDESLHLADFASACVTEVHLFKELADRADDLRGRGSGS
jgi:acetylornithine deacetylase/succinyl-diaminopimelate desuccinylase-like protein